jgi:DNA-binding NtrC family response regulator
MSEQKSDACKSRVLIVDDDEVLRGMLAELLGGDGYSVDAVESGEEGLRALHQRVYELVLLDMHLPGMDGLAVLAASPATQTDAQFVVMTAFGAVDTAVEAMRLGAYDYILKPLRTEELLLTVKRALRETELRREIAQLRNQTRTGARSRIVGHSAPMERLFELIERVAPMRATVLVTGETGTGKELVARAIHDLSGRARHAFVPINCSALPETLLESELFGHVKGSFTGAIASKRGLIEEANGGTLFLDEISTISPAIQVTLLRVLEERKVQRVGATQSVPIDFRLIVATNVNLPKEVESGRFREDLYYRLAIFPIEVPPLRQRAFDVPLLAHHFIRKFAEENDVPAPALSPATIERMMRYDWPGNVRELENFIERAVILHAGTRELRFDISGARPSGERELLEQARREAWDLDRLELEYILAILEQTEGHQGRAAAVLGIDRRTLYRKLKQIRKSAFNGKHEMPATSPNGRLTATTMAGGK